MYFRILLPGFFLLTAACQSYQSYPLDERAHLAEWQGRNASSEAVAEYAARLSSRTGPPREAFDPSDGLGLREAEVVALFFQPALRVARLEAGVELASAENAGRWAAPELGLSGEWILASVSQPWVVGASLRFTIPLSGRLGVERDLAYARHGAALRRVAQAEWDAVAALRAQWRSHEHLLEQAVLTQSYLDELEGLLEIARRLEQAGVISRLDRRLVELERAARQAEMMRLQNAQTESRAHLLELLGLHPDAPLELRFETPAAPALPDERDALLRENNTAVTLRRLEYETAEQQLRLEIRKQYPDLGIGPSYELEGGQSRIGFGLGLPIPVINLNREGIARARAARLAARAVFETELETALHGLRRAELRLNHAEAEHRLLVETVATLADQQVEDANALARLGDFDALRQLEALSRRHETRLAVLASTVEQVRAADAVLALLGPDFEVEEDQ